MCFNNSKSNPRKLQEATDDIICYKKVEFNIFKDLISKSGKGHNSEQHEIKCTPLHRYNRFKYTMGRIHSIGSDEKRKHGNIFNRSNIGNILMCSTVEGGAFHSKIEIKNTCDIDLGEYDDMMTRFTLVVKCTIPRGSKYCMNYEDYISDQLRIDYISLDPKHWCDTISLSKFKHFLTQHKDKFTLI